MMMAIIKIMITKDTVDRLSMMTLERTEDRPSMMILEGTEDRVTVVEREMTTGGPNPEEAAVSFVSKNE